MARRGASRAGRSCLAALCWVAGLAGDVEAQGLASRPLGITQYEPHREFLYRPGRAYDNRAFADWVYPDIVTRGPYQNFYGPLGDHLFRGFEVMSWRETRSTEHTGQVEGSEIVKGGNFTSVFDFNVVSMESQKDWSAALLIANEIRTELTPLTMSLAGLNGVRLDAQSRRGRLSLLGSRYGHPVKRTDQRAGFQGQFSQRNSSLLFGGHGEVRLGALTVGATGLSFHLFDSRQPTFELKGQLQSGQTLPSWLVVRFADDSVEDGHGGAVVADARLTINGQARPDLRPFFVRINARNPTAVGRTSRLTGQFTPVSYVDGGTRFADVLYLRDHLNGQDVSGNVSVERLLRFTEWLPEAAEKRADGEDVVLAYFDLSQEPYVRAVRVEALVGNDYAVDVIGLHVVNERVSNYEAKLATQEVSAAMRATGNAQDLANLRWLSVDVGAFTGRTTLGANGKWEIPGARVRWEYARSVAFRQYPDGRPGLRTQSDISGIRPWRGTRSEAEDAAYFLTAEVDRGPLSAGAEVFAIGPRYDSGFVEDNDDDDRWPDNIQTATDIGTNLGDPGGDPDGVFPGKDEDHDGIPDTNRNGNGIPDYDEAFLLFEVEPDAYVVGYDWNHNGVVDHREDDFRPDYPYSPDQRGYHLFGQVRAPGGLLLAVGHQQARGIAFGGHNDSRYAQLTLAAERPRWGSIRAQSLVQRTRDDIEDPYQIFEEVTRDAASAGRGFQSVGAVYYLNTVIKDRLEYRDSMDWQHYVEGRATPLPGLRLEGNARYEINRQREADLGDGSDQRADRLELVTAVVKAEYVWRPIRQLELTAQWKGLRRWRQRQSLSLALADAWTTIPIVKLRCDVTPRTVFQVGVQGLPGLPLHKGDRADRRLDEEQEVRVVQMSNLSPYFGYQVSTNLGVRVTSRRFDDPTRAVDAQDITAAFLRVLLGFE